MAADHGCFTVKSALKGDLARLGREAIDLGTMDEEPVDYPDFADRVVEALAAGRAGLGVLICGSGIGMSIAANRHPRIRAALCQDPAMARLSRQHNDANRLVLGARMAEPAPAAACPTAFLEPPFGAGRAPRRAASGRDRGQAECNEDEHGKPKQNRARDLAGVWAEERCRRRACRGRYGDCDFHGSRAVQGH